MSKKTSISDEGLRQRLRKLKVIFSDERIKDGQKANAKRLFDKICSKHKIDPESIRLDGYDLANKCVLEVQTDGKNFDAFMRVVCILVGEYWPVQIRGRAFAGANCVLDFITDLPYRPDEAARSYKLIKAKLDEGWSRAQEAWKRQDAPRGGSYFFATLTGRRRAPHRRSYVSGFYHTMKELLDREKAKRAMFRKFLTADERQREEPAALLNEPEPPEPIPVNPLWPVLRSELYCCKRKSQTLKPARCHRCKADAEKAAEREARALRKANEKLMKRRQESQDEADKESDEAMRDRQWEQESDEMDRESYMDGVRSANNFDLNQIKL